LTAQFPAIPPAHYTDTRVKVCKNTHGDVKMQNNWHGNLHGNNQHRLMTGGEEIYREKKLEPTTLKVRG
jgi:hypothetical protein